MVKLYKYILLTVATCALAGAVNAQGPPCTLEGTNISTTVGGACSAGIPPSLTKTVDYNCFECGDLEGSHSTTATGYGPCPGSASCLPYLLDITYLVKKVTIRIQSIYKYLVIFCYLDSVATGVGECTCTTQCQNSPIIISLSDRRLQLTSWQDGVDYDIDADGVMEETAWTLHGRRPDDAFLVLDRNGNGVIDNGLELFGDNTPQQSSDEPNGYAALAVFDDRLSGGDEDGVITPNDAIFSRLGLWIDENHNGFSEPYEISSLVEKGVETISLEYRKTERVDQHGNEYRYKSTATVGGREQPTWDVFFVYGVDGTRQLFSDTEAQRTCSQ